MENKKWNRIYLERLLLVLLPLILLGICLERSACMMILLPVIGLLLITLSHVAFLFLGNIRKTEKAVIPYLKKAALVLVLFFLWGACLDFEADIYLFLPVVSLLVSAFLRFEFWLFEL